MSKDMSKAEKIREELWQTFVYEMDELLESLEQQLLDLHSHGDSEDLMASLFRTMHTVKGTCGMMGLKKVEHFTHKAEDLLDSVRDGKLPISVTIVDALFSVADVLKASKISIIAEKSDDGFHPPESLETELNSILSQVDGAISAGEYGLKDGTASCDLNEQQTETESNNSSLAVELLAEMNEGYDELEKICLDLDVDAVEPDVVAGLFRILHSLKGNMNLAGLKNCTAILHKAEDAIGVVRDGIRPISQQHVDLLLKLVDLLRSGQEENCVHDIDHGNAESLVQFFEEIGSSLTKTESRNQEHLAPASEVLLGSGEALIDEPYLRLFIETTLDHIRAIINCLDSDSPNMSEALACLEDLEHSAGVVGSHYCSHVVKEMMRCLAVGELDDLRRILDSFMGKVHEFQEQPELITRTFTEPTVPASQAMSPDLFFDRLWAELANARKIIDGLSSDSDSIVNACHCIETLKAHAYLSTVIREEGCLEDILSYFRCHSDDIDQCKALSSKKLQELYSVCWDLEDAVMADGAELSLDLNAVKTGCESGPRSTPESETSAVESVPKVISKALTPSPNGHIQHVISAIPECEVPDEIDPLFILDFIEDVRQELVTIESVLSNVQEKSEGNISSDLGEKKTVVQQALERIITGATNVDAFSVAELCQNAMTALEHTEPMSVSEGLNYFSVRMFRALAQIQDSVPEAFQQRHHSELNVSQLYKQWNAEHCLAVAPKLHSFFARLMDYARPNAVDAGLKFVGEQCANIAHVLEGFLFSSQYYRLRDTERAIILLHDFVTRMGFDRNMWNSRVIQLLPKLSDAVVQNVADTHQGQAITEVAIGELIQQLEASLESVSQSHIRSHAAQFLERLHLPECLKKVVDNAAVDKLIPVFDSNKNAFILMMDVEHDDSMADQVFTLMGSEIFETIMSATDFVEERSRFQCLVATTLSADEVSAELKKIDPTQQHLYISTLSVDPQINEATVGNFSIVNYQHHGDHYATLTESISELIAAKSLIDQAMIDSDEDLYEEMDNILNSHNGDWNEARLEIREALARVESERKAVQQAQEQMSFLLGKIQSGLRVLKEVDVNGTLSQLVDHLNIKETLIQAEFVPCEDEIQIDEKDMASVINIIECVIGELGSTSKSALSSRIAVSENVDTVEVSITIDSDNSETALLLKNAVISGRSSQGEHGGVLMTLSPNSSTFVVHVRRELGVVDAIVARVQSYYYVFPTQFVVRILNGSDVKWVRSSVMSHADMLQIDGATVKVMSVCGGQQPNQRAGNIIMLLKYGDSLGGVVVDELIGMQQVVYSPKHSSLASSENISSCVVLGSDRIGFIVDSEKLLSEYKVLEQEAL